MRFDVSFGPGLGFCAFPAVLAVFLVKLRRTAVAIHLLLAM